MALTALDFPASPTNGQLYPDPPVTGQPQYAWNGTQWLSSKAAVTQIARTDALGWSGMQINGSMEVSQELGTTGRTTAGYVLDGWRIDFGGTMTTLAAQSTSITPGLSNSLYINTGTAQPSLGAGDYSTVTHFIEGYRAARLGWGTASAQPITIGFWSKHSPGGLFSVSIQNGSPNRTYIAQYTHTTAGVAQYNTLTIPGDVTGTWAKDNTKGINLTFTRASGTTYTTSTIGAWQAGGFIAGTGQVNNVAANGNEFILAGVVVLPGIEAPTAAQSPRIMRPYDQELLTCQRYYEQIGIGQAGVGHCYAANGIYITINYLTKRTNPTITHTNPTGFQAYSANGSAMSISALGGASNIGLRGAMTFYTLVGSPAVGGHGTSLFTSLPNTSINIDARL